MLAKRIIPTILCRGKTAYKGERFNSWRSVGSALAIARTHAKRGVDELCVLDVAATAERRGPDLDLVRELTEGCFIPVTFGGGVKTIGDIDALLRAGADKVCICTAAIEGGGELILNASARFGSQAITVSIDVRRDGDTWCMTHAGARVGIVDPVQQAKLMQFSGAGEILLQSVDRDGTMQGYDLDLIREVTEAVDIPVIASGGCSGYADMEAAFKAGADACAVGAMFQFTDATPKEASRYLADRGIPMRLA